MANGQCLTKHTELMYFSGMEMEERVKILERKVAQIEFLLQHTLLPDTEIDEAWINTEAKILEEDRLKRGININTVEKL